MAETIKVILGTQWGDEGKGRVVDYYAENTDYVVRFHGGNNAGHTIKVNDKTYKLHIIPSGVVSKHSMNVIGNGVVLDPESFKSELNNLTTAGLECTPNRLQISSKAPLILPLHKSVDQLKEKLKGDKKIGTTGKGIGPAYSDKVNRISIKVSDLRFKDLVQEKANYLEKEYDLYASYFGIEKVTAKQIYDYCSTYADLMLSYMKNTEYTVNNAVAQGKSLIFEGAQGALLDIDFGTYPFVTSSNCIAGNVFSGSGLSVKHGHLVSVYGVVKAYTTRVGEGAFPTEVFGVEDDHLTNKGFEFGTTTGRKRRCGWLDLPALKYSFMINGVSHIALTKLDVLSGLSTIKVCTGYKINGQLLDEYPADLATLCQVEPVYKEFEGWSEDISKVRNFDELPKAAQTYLNFIAKELDNAKYIMISVGAERSDAIFYNI